MKTKTLDSNVMVPLSKDDPCYQAWEQFKKTEDYLNLCRWALHGEEYIDGQLWGVWNRAFFLGLDLGSHNSENFRWLSDRQNFEKILNKSTLSFNAETLAKAIHVVRG